MSAAAAAAAATTTTTAARPVTPPALARASDSSGDRRGALLAALADALAGALGSVVAVAVFYPIDIAKTRAQASSASTTPCKNPNHGDHRGEHLLNRGAASSASGTAQKVGERRGWFRSRTLAALMSIVRSDGGLTRVYEGIEAKALQALLGSFVYFYAYAYIKGVMRRRAAAGGGGGGAPKSLRPSLNLLAAAMAGAVNQAFTLPLENITTRMQTAPHSGYRTEPRAGGAGATTGPRGTFSVGTGGGGGGGRGVLETSMRADSRGDDGTRDIDRCRELDPATPAKTPWGEEGSDAIDSTGHDPLPTRRRQRRQRPRQSFAAVTGELYREGGGIGRFWRGFAPSLILTCNPAINYTAFDVLKALWLRRREAVAASAIGSGGPGIGGAGGAVGGTAQRGAGGFLNPLEAFFVAAAAKSLATVITYPLIRTKVVLMTSRASSSSAPNMDVGSNPVSPIPPPLEGGDGGGRWASGRSVTPTNHVVTGVGAVNGIGGGGGGVDGRTFVNGQVAAVAPPTTERGAPEPMGASVVPTAADEATVEVNNSRGMGTVLVEIFRREGFGGLYAGCGAQLLHTILKSALLLATKEQIARAAASAVFFGGNRSGAAGAS